MTNPAASLQLTKVSKGREWGWNKRGLTWNEHPFSFHPLSDACHWGYFSGCNRDRPTAHTQVNLVGPHSREILLTNNIFLEYIFMTAVEMMRMQNFRKEKRISNSIITKEWWDLNSSLLTSILQSKREMGYRSTIFIRLLFSSWNNTATKILCMRPFPFLLRWEQY